MDIKNFLNYILAFSVIVCTSSCKKFVEVGLPAGAVDSTVVYNNESSATAAVLSLYSTTSMRDNLLYMTLFCGLSADELNYFQTSSTYLDFQNNNLSANTASWANVLWLYPYNEIVNANAAINGLQKTTALNAGVRNQLLGESKFWRALAYFNLVNCFGDVPLALSSSAQDNALLPRASTSTIYTQIIHDLKDAKGLLSPTYPTQDRARVNIHAVSALLARVYLYRKDWVNAEAEANSVIVSNVYKMSQPEVTFQKTSTETILQIYTQRGFTQWGVQLVPSSPNNIVFYLRPEFIGSFETNDKRRNSWVTAIGTSGKYNVSKYKLRTASDGNEYYIMLRLSEQYLIRAEARAQLNNLSGSLADLNTVRTRAGLTEKENLTQEAILLAVEQERKVELFGEYAHRWFDLKRNPSLNGGTKTRADDIIAPLKPATWQSTDILFPISTNEITKNPNLSQNPGY